MTREELADRIGIKYPTLSKYETSIRQPDFETLVLLSKYLRVSTDYILGCTSQRNRLKQKELDKETEELWDKYRNLSDEAKARIKNQISFEYAQQNNL